IERQFRRDADPKMRRAYGFWCSLGGRPAADAHKIYTNLFFSCSNPLIRKKRVHDGIKASYAHMSLTSSDASQGTFFDISCIIKKATSFGGFALLLA
ncbi:hypothetical protein LH384_32320, partial [Pseudomonas aeruginosa]|nr:hypothetical protein [Pseudomonas aeruginosa]